MADRPSNDEQEYAQKDQFPTTLNLQVRNVRYVATGAFGTKGTLLSILLACTAKNQTTGVD